MNLNKVISKKQSKLNKAVGFLHKAVDELEKTRDEIGAEMVDNQNRISKYQQAQNELRELHENANKMIDNFKSIFKV